MGLSPAQLEAMAAANPTGGGNYVQHGRYVFIVDHFIQKYDGFNGASIVTEFFVAESAPATDGKRSDGPHNPRGSRCSVALNLTGGKGGAKAAQAAQGNLKALVIGLLGKDGFDAMMANDKLGATPGERYAKVLELLENNGRGAMLADETFMGKIQSGPNAGKDIVNHKWSYVDTSDIQRQKNLAVLDGKMKIEDAFSSPIPTAAQPATATA